MFAAVAQLNNLGVACLDNLDLREALDLFRDALKYHLGNVEPADDLARAVPVSDKVHSDNAPQSRHPLDPSKISPLSYVWDTPSSAQFVYARGINIVASPTAYSPDVFVNATIVSSIIIFNLAAVYHLKGVEECGDRDARMSKARLRYDKSDLLLKDAGVPMSSTGNPAIDMLSMALFKNLAQASFELGYDIVLPNSLSSLHPIQWQLLSPVGFLVVVKIWP
jgi:hypothetical protein